MAELTTVARPYAKAAYEAALKQGTVAEWSATLGLSAAVANEEKMKMVLDHPALTSVQKAEAFIGVCDEQMNEASRNFVQVLAENGRLALIPEIARLFEEFKAQQEQSIDVTVETAFELTQEQEEKLAQALTKKLEREVRIHGELNKTLLGGVVIRAGDMVIDASVRGKLAKLAEAIYS